MDPSLDESAMAAMMGFSAFGAQDRPQKKRRYHAHQDYSASKQTQLQDAINGDQLGSSCAGSVPAGGEARGLATNNDEISLDDEDDVTPRKIGDAESQPHQQSLDSLPRPASLPERPPTASAAGFSSGASPGQQRHGRQWHDASRGPWYEGYYDPSSNENPWARLEKARGLQALGAWTTQGSQSTVVTDNNTT